MTLPDLVNGLFELLGGVLIAVNCMRLHRDKVVRGVNVWVTVFFTSWGFWNVWYYPFLDQWLSFAGGLVIVAANCVWVSMAVYYTRLERGRYENAEACDL
jgi:uncharacterized membrane protein YfcA